MTLKRSVIHSKKTFSFMGGLASYACSLCLLPFLGGFYKKTLNKVVDYKGDCFSIRGWAPYSIILLFYYSIILLGVKHTYDL